MNIKGGGRIGPNSVSSWLELVNTRPLRDGERTEMLDSFPSLFRWLHTTAVLDSSAARDVEARWASHPEQDAVLESALRLRASLESLAQSCIAGAPPGDDAIAEINRILATQPCRREVVRDGNGFRTSLHPLTEHPVHLLVPFAASAAGFLEHGDPGLLRQCDNPACVLYFYDTTRNRSRRWCSMEACGNRMKVTAYHRRRRGDET